MIPFQCLQVEAELYLANKLTEKAMSGYVQLARYISTPISLSYGTSRPSNYSPFLQGQNGSFSHQVIRQTLENLKDALYPYKKASNFS